MDATHYQYRGESADTLRFPKEIPKLLAHPHSRRVCQHSMSYATLDPTVAWHQCPQIAYMGGKGRR